MATFRYKAVNAQGSFSEGQVDAIDTRTAAYRLQGMGLIPVSIEQPSFQRTGSSLFSKIYAQRISKKDILFFTEELSTLVRCRPSAGSKSDDHCRTRLQTRTACRNSRHAQAD